jgi:hypothetical protein
VTARPPASCYLPVPPQPPHVMHTLPSSAPRCLVRNHPMCLLGCPLHAREHVLLTSRCAYKCRCSSPHNAGAAQLQLHTNSSNQSGSKVRDGLLGLQSETKSSSILEDACHVYGRQIGQGLGRGHKKARRQGVGLQECRQVADAQVGVAASSHSCSAGALPLLIQQKREIWRASSKGGSTAAAARSHAVAVVSAGAVPALGARRHG